MGTTDTTLRLVGAAAAAACDAAADAQPLHPITALRQWACDLGQAWRERRANAAEAAALDGLERLGPRLLADIGAPDALRDRAIAADDLRHRHLLDVEQGHRGVFDGRW